MNEKRFIAVMLGLAAGLTALSGSLIGAAQTPGLEWVLPTAIVSGSLGVSIGAGTLAYQRAFRDAIPNGDTSPYEQRAEMIGGDRRDPGADNAYPGG